MGAISSSGNLPDPETELESVVSSSLAGRFFTTEPSEKPCTKRWELVTRD